jgi:hypothetical protein
MRLADFIPAWANAIAQFEGFNTPGTRPARNFNPGDLKYAGQPGATGADPAGFAIFPTPVAGFQALYLQLQKYVRDYPDDSLLDIMAHYLGQASPTVNAQGNAVTYASYVAQSLGVDPTATLAQIAGLVVPSLDPGSAPADATSLVTADTPPAASDMAGWVMAAAVAIGAWLVVRAWA